MTRRRRVLAVTAAALLGALGYSRSWVYLGRVATVERNRLYRSAALSDDRLLDLCRLHRITTVVDLREESPETLAEAKTLARAGIAHVGLPTGQVPSRETVARFLQVMDAKRHEAVLVHCAQGVGRSGVFSAIYRMEVPGMAALASHRRSDGPRRIRQLRPRQLQSGVPLVLQTARFGAGAMTQ